MGRCLKFGSSSWSPLSDHSPVLVFTIDSDGRFQPLCHAKGRHQKGSLALVKFIPCLWRTLEFSSKYTSAFIPSLIHSSTTTPNTGDINLNKTGSCPQAIQNQIGKINKYSDHSNTGQRVRRATKDKKIDMRVQSKE